MKRFFLFLVAIIFLGFSSANAETFRGNVNACNGQSRFIFKGASGQFELYQNGERTAYGTYDLNRAQRQITLTVVVNGQTGKWLLTNVSFSNNGAFMQAHFNREIYYLCRN